MGSPRKSCKTLLLHPLSATPPRGWLPLQLCGPLSSWEGSLCHLVQGQLPEDHSPTLRASCKEVRTLRSILMPQTAQSSSLLAALSQPPAMLSTSPVTSTSFPTAPKFLRLSAEPGMQRAQGSWLAVFMPQGLVSMSHGPVTWHWHCPPPPCPSLASPILAEP